MFFDSNTTETVEFAPLPMGLYTITCLVAEYGPTKNGSGAILKVEFAPDGAGDQKLMDNFNLENANPKAALIGRSQLKSLCEKMGRPQLRSPGDLVGGRLRCKVIHTEHEGKTYANVEKYIALSEGASQNVQSVQPQQQPVAQHQQAYQQPAQPQGAQVQPDAQRQGVGLAAIPF